MDRLLYAQVMQMRNQKSNVGTSKPSKKQQPFEHQQEQFEQACGETSEDR
jgi:hypothetical protein